MKYISPVALCAACLVAVVTSCSPAVTSHIVNSSYAPLPANAPVALISPRDTASCARGAFIGTYRVGDSGFTASANGTFGKVFALAQDEARKAGGNAITIDEHDTPDFVSTIHRIRGGIWHIDSIARRRGHPPVRRPVVEAFPGSKVSPGVDETLFYASSDSAVSPVAVGRKAPKLRFGGHCGYGWQIGKHIWGKGTYGYQRELNLMKGIVYGADITGYFSDFSGFGILFDDQRTSSVFNTFPVMPSETSTEIVDYGKYKTTLDIWFLGPVASLRAPLGNWKHFFVADIGLGYLGFHMKESLKCHSRTEMDANGVCSGGTLGTVTRLALDFGLAKNLFLGVQATFIAGKLSGYTLQENGGAKVRVDLDNTQRISLSRVELSAALRVAF